MVKQKDVRLFCTPFLPAPLGEVSRGHSDEYDEKKATSICGLFLFMVPALSSGLPRITMVDVCISGLIS